MRAGRVGDRRRLRYADTEHAAGGAGVARTDTDEHADRAVRMRCSAVEYDAHPPTITGSSNSRMNFFRFSGWRSGSCDTCSADTTVPCTTRTSSSAASTCLENCSTRCGVSDAHAVTPPALISPMRTAMSSALIGSAYSSCIRRVALSAGSDAISSNTASGSS